MKKGNYNCYVIYFSERKVKGKTKYQFKNWEVYHGVSKELACFYAFKNSNGQMLGFNQPFTEKAEVLKAKFVLSYNPYDNVICIVQKYSLKQGRGWEAQYPLHPLISISIGNFSHQIEEYINCFKDYDKEKKTDYSIEAANIWGPRNLIPAGYKHVESGEVQEGDLYWKYDSYGSRLGDYWCECEISFSGHKPGSKIELSGIVNVNEDGSKETVNFYHPFVVRKKQ